MEVQVLSPAPRNRLKTAVLYFYTFQKLKVTRKTSRKHLQIGKCKLGGAMVQYLTFIVFCAYIESPILLTGETDMQYLPN